MDIETDLRKTCRKCQKYLRIIYLKHGRENFGKSDVSLEEIGRKNKKNLKKI